MTFLEHDSFTSECSTIQRRQAGLSDGISSLKKLLEKQFDPIQPIPSIGPGKIHRVTETQTWAIWKVEVAVPKSGLRPSQWPRLWIVVSGDTIAFLKIASHMDNYDNAVCERSAISRATDIF